MKVYSRPLSISYHANTVSCSTLFALLYLAGAIILPYVTAYGLGNMWIREVLVREQPLTRFRNEVLVQAYGTSNTDPIASWAWSTSTPINDMLGSSLRPMELYAWDEDDERDGRVDRLRFDLSVPLDRDNDERLLSIAVLVGVEVVFRNEFELMLNSSLVMEASSPLPGDKWVQVADLTMQSQKPQQSKVTGRRNACMSPTWAFKDHRTPTGGAATIESTLASYDDALCNDTAALLPQPPIWTPGLRNIFQASLTVRVPRLQLTRRPSVPETFKLAFVQYMAFFIPIAAILYVIYSCLFTTGVLSARMHHPVKQHAF